MKWDVPFVTENVIPMWIADMDFEVAPAITRKLREAAEQGAFGYQFLSDKYYQAVINWMDKRHGYPLTREEICFVPNVVMGMGYAIQAISEPGDEIIIQTPVYGPFFDVIKDSDRTLVECQMNNDAGYYTINLEEFERKITSKTKATIICNPHNPSGRVWTKEELQQLAEICLRHNLYIISDDIHSELVWSGHHHTFISLLSEEIRQRCIVCTSPSKAFNLAGIHLANCFIANEEVRNNFRKHAEKFHAAENTSFAEAALLGAYNESGEWLDELNAYIEDNIDYFVDYIKEHIPQLKVYKPEGTYLVWVDCHNLNLDINKFQEFFLTECHIAVNDGEFFGAEGKGFVRFNLACPRSTVEEALKRIESVIVR